MRQVTRKGLMTVAAASGVFAVTGGYAVADSGAEGAAVGSPGVLAGNLVQAPVDVPVNVCGNTVDVVGLLNPAFGNDCQNGSGGQAGPGGYGDEDGGGQHGGGSHHSGGGAHASGQATGSPGVGSGNEVQIPVNVPVNVCGNNISVVGLLNPVFGNDCANETTPRPPHPGHPEHPGTPEKPDTPKTPDTPKPPKEHTTPPSGGSVQISAKTPPAPTQQLAETGSEVPAGALGAAAAGMLLAGAVVYRKARANA
ncbi:chaplin [Streptomyces sp. P6-2-1]|uniref:chaplin n=1 Tax=Streptomyces sp. P6-2-1 TaxID=3422591 RepID=UPI003D36E76A